MICLHCEEDVEVNYDKKERCLCSRCGFEIDNVIVKNGFNYILILGKTSQLGTIRFILNKETKKFSFCRGVNGMFGLDAEYFGPYYINDIKDLTISNSMGLIYQLSSANVESTTTFIAASNNKNNNYLIGIKINDVNMPGICFENKDSDIVYRFLSMLEFLRDTTDMKE